MPSAWSELREIAAWASQCAQFPDVAGNADYALAKIAFGQEIGLGPIASLVNVFFKDGLPAMRAAAIAARITAHPDYDYRVVTLTDSGCTIEFLRCGEPVGMCTYDADDARRTEPVVSRFWQQHPKAMFFARALGIGARRYCAPVFGGALYATAELPGCETGVDDRLPGPPPPPRQAPNDKPTAKSATVTTILARHNGDLAAALAGYAAFMRQPLPRSFHDVFLEDLQCYARSLAHLNAVA